MKSTAFQWELWKYCNNNCKFCILGKDNIIIDKSKQLRSLEDLSFALDNLDYTICDTISLIGGEFFQGQLDNKEIHDRFFDTIKKIFNLYLDKKIDNIWITCTLTIGDQKHLYELLDLAQEMNIDRLWLCTSWDAKGRFQTEQMQNNWETNMLNIKEKYPKSRVITNIILQQAFIDLYLNNKFKPKEFMAKFHTLLFYNNCSLPDIYHKEYYEKFKVMTDEEIDEYLLKEKQSYNKSIGYNFFPTRNSFIEFLAKYYNEDRDTFDRLYNDDFECDKKYKYDQNHLYNLNAYKDNIIALKCKSNHDKLLYSPYVDSMECCICDKISKYPISNRDDNIITSFQWELWKTCNNHCDFCFLELDKKIYNKERQLQSIIDFNKAIDNLDYTVYNNISIIGGEFFQGQLDDKEIHDRFFDTVKKIFQMYIDHKIINIWITCTLTIGDQKHLYELLDLAQEMNILPVSQSDQTGILLCTSWDAKGRFHNSDMEHNWEYHMLNIKKRYPWVKFNTTIILQQAFIDLYLNNKFKPKEFIKKYNTTLFYNMCQLPDEYNLRYNKDINNNLEPEISKLLLNNRQSYNKSIGYNFFPTRNSFIEFLAKYYNEDRDTFDRLYNIKYRADTVYRKFDSKMNDFTRDKYTTFNEINIKTNTCGHTYDYQCYSDSTKCCMCDKKYII